MPKIIEDLFDLIVSPVEVRGEVRCNMGKQEFAKIMGDLIAQEGLSTRTVKSGDYVIKVSGRTLGNLGQIRSRWTGAEPRMYEDMKSRLRFHLTDEGTIEVTSYEHMIGYQNERSAFEEVLRGRLEAATEFLESRVPEGSS